MIKTFTLALCAAAFACTSQAAIVSMDFGGTLTDGAAVSGTVRWDTSASPNSGAVPTFATYAVPSMSLTISGTDYSAQLNAPQLTLRLYDPGIASEDSLSVYATVSGGTGALANAGAIKLLLDGKGETLTQTFEQLFSTANPLPGNLDFLSKVVRSQFLVSMNNGDAPLVAEGLTLTATPAVVTPPPPTTPTVPEPGSLLLVAMAGLALVGTRRRQHPLAA